MNVLGAHPSVDKGTGSGFALLLYLTIAGALALVVCVSSTCFAPIAGGGTAADLTFPGSAVLGGWVHFDGNWYLLISTHGYSYTPGAQSSVAFFPGYPLAMWALAPLTDLFDPSRALDGILVTFLSGAAFAILLQRWCAHHVGAAAARLAVVLALVYPYAWYLFGAVYADALFAALAVGAFLLVESDHPVLAGLCAAAATATRPIGIALVVALVALVVPRRRVLRRQCTAIDSTQHLDDHPVASSPPPRRAAHVSVRLSDASVLLGASGLLGWCAYLWANFGDPLLFASIEGAPGWDQASGPHTWFKVHWFGLLRHLPDHVHATGVDGVAVLYTAGVTFQALLALLAFAALPSVRRRVGFPAALYVGLVVLIAAVGTKDWQGTGRYLLAAFPLWPAVAEPLARPDRRAARVAVVGGSLILLVVLTSLYARGAYLA